MRLVEHEISIMEFVLEFSEIIIVNANSDKRGGWGRQPEHNSANR